MNDIQHAGSGNTANRLRRFPWYSTVRHASARQARAAVFLPSLSATHKGISISESHSVVSDSLRPHRLHSPWSSPGQIIGVGSPSLLQGIFPTQGLNPGLPHCRRILYQLSHKGSPRIPETQKDLCNFTLEEVSKRVSFCPNIVNMIGREMVTDSCWQWAPGTSKTWVYFCVSS